MKLHNIDISKIKHGNVIDDIGLIDKGRSFEIDFYETNYYVYVFEVKALQMREFVEQILISKKLLEAKCKKHVKAFVAWRRKLKRERWSRNNLLL